MTPTDPKQERTWAMICHLSALTVLLRIPFAHLLGPLVVWLLKRNESPFVDEQGKEAINFQISMTIYMILAGLLVFVFIGYVFLVLLVVIDVVLVLIACLKVSNGEPFQYPFAIRIIK